MAPQANAAHFAHSNQMVVNPNPHGYPSGYFPQHANNPWMQTASPFTEPQSTATVETARPIASQIHSSQRSVSSSSSYAFPDDDVGYDENDEDELF